MKTSLQLSNSVLDRLQKANTELMRVYPGDTNEDQLAELVEIMRRDEVEIGIDLGLGDATATVFGCDLSDGYIRINADYTT